KLIEDQGGTVSQVQDWGIRDLAYLLAKQRRAFYVLFEYRGTSKGLLEIERNLKLMERVLRFVSVRQAENAPPAPPRTAPRHPEPDHGELRSSSAPADPRRQAGPHGRAAALHVRLSMRRARCRCK